MAQGRIFCLQDVNCNMKIAFYKGRKRLFNRLVSWWTRGPYSHAELVFSDGICASSSFMDKGVRFKQIELTPENWDILPLPTCFDEAKSRKWFEWNQGKQFDTFGMFGIALPFLKQSPGKYFCIESILTSLGFIGGWRIEPNACYTLIQRLQNLDIQVRDGIK